VKLEGGGGGERTGGGGGGGRELHFAPDSAAGATVYWSSHATDASSSAHGCGSEEAVQSHVCPPPPSAAAASISCTATYTVPAAAPCRPLSLSTPPKRAGGGAMGSWMRREWERVWWHGGRMRAKARDCGALSSLPHLTSDVMHRWRAEASGGGEGQGTAVRRRGSPRSCALRGLTSAAPSLLLLLALPPALGE
jgi:hypothetical protein